MIDVLGIDHVVFRVIDAEAMQRFYSDVLGARLERRDDGIGLIQLRLGNCLVDLVPVDGSLGLAGGSPPNPDGTGHNVDHVCFRVSPWDDRVVDHLAAHGIPAEISTRYGAEGYGPSIYLSDPEGNRLELRGPPEKQALNGPERSE